MDNASALIEKRDVILSLTGDPCKDIRNLARFSLVWILNQVQDDILLICDIVTESSWG